MKKRLTLHLKTRKLMILGLVGIVSLGFTACGQSKNSDITAEYATSEVADSGELYSYDYDSDMGDMEEGAEEIVNKESKAEVDESAQSNRKLIRNVTINAETESFDNLLSNIEAKVESLGGYIESSDIYNGNYLSGYGTDSRSASLTARIPAENLDVFISEVEENSNITNKNESVEDVTLQYVDLESHKKALTEEQERLFELLEQAESMEDIISIEDKLADVRYQLESMESQLRTFDNQITYSTVYLNINEVTRISPQNPETVGERISTGISETLYNVKTGFVDLFVWFIVNLPVLVIWAIVITIIVLIIKKIRKSRKKKKEKEIYKTKEPYEVKEAPETKDEVK